MALKDYLTIMSDRTQKALIQIEDLRAANPEEAAREDERMKQEMIRKREEYISRRMQIQVAENYNSAKEEEEEAKRQELINVQDGNLLQARA